MTAELIAQYDSRKSFYGKATVTTIGNVKALHSYGTHVSQIDGDGNAVVYGTHSDTTLRHIKEFLKQNGFKADTKKQIMADYGGTK